MFLQEIVYPSHIFQHQGRQLDMFVRTYRDRSDSCMKSRSSVRHAALIRVWGGQPMRIPERCASLAR